MSTCMKTIALTLLAVVAFPLAAMAAGGGATPDAAFNNFKNSMKAKDYKTGYQQLTPDTQDMMLGGMAMAMSMGMGMDQSKLPEAKKLIEDHGIKTPDITKLQPNQDPRELMKQTLAGVKDKASCFADLMAWMEANSNDKDKAKRMEEYGNASVTDVKIDGDSATGNVKMTQDGKENTSPMNFRKVGGMWYIDLIPPAGAQGGGAPQQGGAPGGASQGQ